MKKCLLLLVLVIVFAYCGCSSRAEESAAVGQHLPDIAVTCADGRSFSSAEALAEHRLLGICLFGSGCGACRKMLTAVQEAAADYPDLALVGLSLDRTYDTPEALTAFAAEEGIAFPLAQDPARLLRTVGLKTYPVLILADGEGIIRHVEAGAESPDHYREIFSYYLGVPLTLKNRCAPDN